MKYTHIVWDFNGTILDDVAAGIASVNDMLAKRSLPVIDSVEKYRSLMRFPIIDYYRDLGFDFGLESYSVLADEWVAGYISREGSMPLTDGATETIRAISRSGVRQIVLSASELGMLKRQLSARKLLDCFDEVIGLDNVRAAGKASLAEAWARRERPQSALFIGDTVHDFETASAASKFVKTDCVLFSGGHGSAASLASTGASVVSKIGDIMNFLN